MTTPRRKSVKRKPQKRTRRQTSVKDLLTNVLLLGLVLVIAGFAWSFLSNGFTSDKTKFSPTDLSTFLQKSEFEVQTGHRITVEILNGCGTAGLAGMFSDFLREQGLDVIQSDNADNFHYEQSLILLREGSREKAQVVADILGIDPANIREEPDPDLFLDVTIIIGQDHASLNHTAD